MKCWAPRGVHAPRTAGTWTETRTGEEVLSTESRLHTEPASQFLTQRLLRCGETGQRQLTPGPFCLPAHGFRMREPSSGLQAGSLDSVPCGHRAVATRARSKGAPRQATESLPSRARARPPQPGSQC